MNWNNNLVVNSAVAIMAFIFALTVDYFILTSSETIIGLITDPIYYAIAYGGLILVLIGMTILAPLLAIISVPQQG